MLKSIQNWQGLFHLDLNIWSGAWSQAEALLAFQNCHIPGKETWSENDTVCPIHMVIWRISRRLLSSFAKCCQLWGGGALVDRRSAFSRMRSRSLLELLLLISSQWRERSVKAASHRFLFPKHSRVYLSKADGFIWSWQNLYLNLLTLTFLMCSQKFYETH